jgi:hypothetical protein
MSSPATSHNLSAKERLIAFLVVYESASLQNADKLLSEFRGRERDLFRILGRRYGLSTTQALNVGVSLLGVILCNLVFPFDHFCVVILQPRCTKKAESATQRLRRLSQSHPLMVCRVKMLR